MKLILLIMFFFSSFMFMFMKHPLSMGFMLLIQTFISCLVFGLINYSCWFSYILFITFVGGMLVLFIYVASIASNEKFKFSLILMMFFLLIFLCVYLLMFISDQYYFNMMCSLLESLGSYSNSIYINGDLNSLIKMFNYPTMIITMLSVIFLLITMISIVKVTNIFEGPLRMKI
uniref:NADH-ubiquinone oxidoreductase chain 6 n=1 Tax=Clovia sp. EMHAU-2015-Zz052918 TaxID=2038646 RepID=A0A343K661_9HEMI|nr:NADH dehydrogenase subunit 6 [Clovia sp. EMHAU-2015-Zz052918]